MTSDPLVVAACGSCGERVAVWDPYSGLARCARCRGVRHDLAPPLAAPSAVLPLEFDGPPVLEVRDGPAGCAPCGGLHDGHRP